MATKTRRTVTMLTSFSAVLLLLLAPVAMVALIFVLAFTTVAPGGQQAAERVKFDFAPLNPNADGRAALVPRWPTWHYHRTFLLNPEHGPRGVVTWMLKAKRLEWDDDGFATMVARLTVEVANASGRFISDDMKDHYELRVGYTAWLAGATASPAFVLGRPAGNLVVGDDQDVVGGLTAAQAAQAVEEVFVAIAGYDGEPKLCRTLTIAMPNDVQVACGL